MTSRALSKSVKIQFGTSGLGSLKRDLGSMSSSILRTLREVRSATDAEAVSARREAQRAFIEQRRDIAEANRQVKASARELLASTQSARLGVIENDEDVKKLQKLRDELRYTKESTDKWSSALGKAEAAQRAFFNTDSGKRAMDLERRRKDLAQAQKAEEGQIYSMAEVQQLITLKEQLSFLRKTHASKTDIKAARRELRKYEKSDEGGVAISALQGLAEAKRMTAMQTATIRDDKDWQHMRKLADAVSIARASYDKIADSIKAAKIALTSFLQTTEGRGARQKLLAIPALLRRFQEERINLQRQATAGTLPGLQKFDDKAYREALDAARFQTLRELQARVAGGGARGQQAAAEIRSRSSLQSAANFKYLAMSIGGATAAFAAFKAASLAYESINLAAQVEKTTVAFGSLTGNIEKSAALVELLKSRSMGLPVELGESLSAVRTMLATGSDLGDVAKDLELLTNIAAGADQPLSQIATIYGEIRTKNRLYREDVLQFSRRGIPIMEELAKMYGVSRDALNKMVSDGQIDFEVFRQALIGLTSEGGRFASTVENMGETTIGKITKLNNALEVMKINLGQVLLGIDAAWLGFSSFGKDSVLGFLTDKLENIAYLLEFIGKQKLPNLEGESDVEKARALRASAISLRAGGEAARLVDEDLFDKRLRELTRKEQDPVNAGMLKGMLAGTGSFAKAFQQSPEIAKFLTDYIAAKHKEALAAENAAKSAEESAGIERRLSILRSGVSQKTQETADELVDQERLGESSNKIDREILQLRRTLNSNFDSALALLNEQTQLSTEAYNKQFDQLVQERLLEEGKIDALQRQNDLQKQNEERRKKQESLLAEAEAFEAAMNPAGAAAKKLLEVAGAELAPNVKANLIAAAINQLGRAEPRTPFSPFMGEGRSAWNTFQRSILSNSQDRQLDELEKMRQDFDEALELLQQLSKAVPADWPNIITREVARLNARAG